MREPDDNLETFGAIVLVVLLVLAILITAPIWWAAWSLL